MKEILIGLILAFEVIAGAIALQQRKKKIAMALALILIFTTIILIGVT